MAFFKALLATGAIIFIIIMVTGLVMLVLPMMVVGGVIALLFLIMYQYFKDID
jgi:hypothetical protein